jgi:hypothetical protein
MQQLATVEDFILATITVAGVIIAGLMSAGLMIGVVMIDVEKIGVVMISAKKRTSVPEATIAVVAVLEVVKTWSWSTLHLPMDRCSLSDLQR